MECRKKVIRPAVVAAMMVVLVVVIMVVTLAPSKPAEEPATEHRVDSTRRCEEVHLSSSYDSTPLGHSKNFFEPKPPARFRSEKYPEPEDLPPSSTWGCGCFVVNRSAVCPHRLDSGIPACVDAAVEAVFLHSKEADRLLGLRHFPKLQYIEIVYIKIELLGNDLFDGNKDLNHLVVFDTQKLTYLNRDVFRGATNLEHVVVSYTNISSLEPDVFTHLKKLKILDLSNNKITSLPEGIFRDNLELQELQLSGNPLHINSDVSKVLLRNNAKLRVLYMDKCGLQELPPGLLSNAHSLEWLDLSGNKMSKFPAEFIQDCPRLSHLVLEFCGLESFSSDVLLQRGGSFSTLDLSGNHFRCDCDLVPLASWDTLRHYYGVSGAFCWSPEHLKGTFLRDWLTGSDALECSAATASLRTDLNRALTASRAIAREGAASSADREVGFIAANYFLLAMAARTSAEVSSVASHWARLLEGVLQRRHNLTLPGAADAAATPEPPPAAATSRSEGFEPVVNFTYVTRSVPENLTKAVDDGIADELNTLFRYVNATEAKRMRIADCDEKQHFSGSTAASKSFEDVLATPKKLNATEEVVLGLRRELREFLLTLLKSVERAKKDARY